MKWIVLVLVLLNLSYCAWQNLSFNQASAELRNLSQPLAHRLLMWSEWEADAAFEAVAQLQPVAVTTAAAISKKNVVNQRRPEACYTLGPFYLVHDVSRAAAAFESRGVTTQQRAAAERKQGGFWVFIPPRRTLSDARGVLRQLQSNGIHDPLIIAEGRKENAISVGVFSSQARAEQRRDDVLQLGYEVSIEPLQHTQPLYWLDLEIWQQSVIPQDLWRQMTRDFPNLTQQGRVCS